MLLAEDLGEEFVTLNLIKFQCVIVFNKGDKL